MRRIFTLLGLCLFISYELCQGFQPVLNYPKIGAEVPIVGSRFEISFNLDKDYNTNAYEDNIIITMEASADDDPVPKRSIKLHPDFLLEGEHRVNITNLTSAAL